MYTSNICGVCLHTYESDCILYYPKEVMQSLVFHTLRRKFNKLHLEIIRYAHIYYLQFFFISQVSNCEPRKIKSRKAYLPCIFLGFICKILWRDWESYHCSNVNSNCLDNKKQIKNSTFNKPSYAPYNNLRSTLNWICLCLALEWYRVLLTTFFEYWQFATKTCYSNF